jgi:hypothetical protein
VKGLKFRELRKDDNLHLIKTERSRKEMEKKIKYQRNLLILKVSLKFRVYCSQISLLLWHRWRIARFLIIALGYLDIKFSF